MVKYVKFTEYKNEFTTLSFRDIGVSNVEITGYSIPVVKLEGEDNDINSLVSAQSVEIQCQEILIDEFTEMIKDTPQYIRQKELESIEKIRALGSAIVTVSSGKVFYADNDSRVDIATAIEVGTDSGINETVWKLAEEFEGSKYATVTIEELKEARYLALMEKGSIVGVKK